MEEPVAPPQRADRFTQADITDIQMTAHALADAARAAILPVFRHAGLATDDKDPGRFDPVTEADRSSEAAMRAILADRRPDDAILGEEEAPKPGTSGLTWVLDPIDGTRAFICGTPTWGVLIALSDADGPLYGMIDQPYIGERFEGGLGIASVTGPLGEAPLAVRRGKTLAEATLFTTFPEIGTPAERAGFEAVRDRVKLTRYGCDCYAYALLAAGQIDLVIEAGLAPYDIAAPIAVIEAAGGIVTDWHGGPAHPGGRALAAATPALHAEALTLLKDVR
ncbi:MAG: histidinol-phosphatase [Pseudomonadota bacterium]